MQAVICVSRTQQRYGRKSLGSVGESFVLNCWFEQDVSAYLPASLIAEEVERSLDRTATYRG